MRPVDIKRALVVIASVFLFGALGHAAPSGGAKKIIALSGNLNFGNVAVGSSAQRNLVISNLGTASLTVTNISYPAGFSGNWSAGSIKAGRSQTVIVTFRPTGQTNYSGLIRVLSDATSGTNGITASGTGTAPIIALGGSLAFGTVTVGTNAQRSLIITNNGSATLTVTNITYPTGFSGNWSSGTIATGATRTVTVTFSPAAITNYGGNVTVISSAGRPTLAASGAGGGAIIALTGNLSFSNVIVGNIAQRTLTISNSGNIPLVVSNITYPAGFSGNWSSGTIAASNTQNVTVTFTPVSATSYSGNITVSSSAIRGTNTIRATGTGIAATRVISVAGNLNFGSIAVDTSVQKTLVISNGGNSTLTVSNIIYPAGYNGNWSAGSLAPNASQNVTVTFAPTSAGNFNGSINVQSDATTGTHTISASGIATNVDTRILSLGGDLNFGNVTVGSFSQQTLGLTNSGNATLTISNIVFPSGYSGNWSNAVIVAGGATNLTITFSPALAIPYNGSVQFVSDATAGGSSINVSGTGLAPIITRLISLSGNLNFGNVVTGKTAQLTFTITNAGNSTLTVSNITYPAGFTGDWPSGTIAAGVAQNVNVTFAPSAVNGYSGTVKVFSDATGGANTLSVSGTGVQSSVSVAPGITLLGDLNFGDVLVDTIAQRTLTISNSGNAILAVSNLDYPAQPMFLFGGFSGNWSGVIAPGKTQSVTVTFAPSGIAIVGFTSVQYGGILDIESDAVSGTGAIAISGTGIFPGNTNAPVSIDYVPAKAKFNGLFYPSNSVTYSNSGYFSASTSTKGTVSAKFRLAGKQYPFTGVFSTNGAVSGTIVRSGLSSLAVSLQVTDNGDAIAGTLADQSGAWTASIFADRAAFSAKTNPAPQAGVYSLVIAGGNDASQAPTNSGTATVTIATSGAVKVSGLLGDGTKISQTSALSANGQWPMYVSLYGNKGCVIGWPTITGAGVTGLLEWSRLPLSGSTNYPDGFSLETAVSGNKN